jgi:hypothetical protein
LHKFKRLIKHPNFAPLAVTNYSLFDSSVLFEPKRRFRIKRIFAGVEIPEEVVRFPVPGVTG